MSTHLRRRFTILLAFLICSISSFGQSDSLSYEEQITLLQYELDSLTIFSLLDSVLTNTAQSEFAVRFGYSSSRLSAGRDFNLEQKGYYPGIAYYHKSGFYTDITSFFNNNSTPALTQSIWHLGYIWVPNSTWALNPYFEKAFNHYDNVNSLDKTIGINALYDLKIAELSIDYGLLWGDDTGHRLIPSISRKIEIGNIPILRTLKVYPGISVVAGTTSIFKFLYAEEEVNNYLLTVQQLTEREIRNLVLAGQITTEQAIQLRITRRLINAENIENDVLIELLNSLVEDNSFELLSLNFSLPIMINIKNTSILLSYTYSIPQELPGEDLGIDPTGYFSCSVSQRFGW